MRLSTPRVPHGVWKAKWKFLALLFGTATLITTNAAAQSKKYATARPGLPSARVKAYKLDDELSRRAKTGNPAGTTRVILELVPGAQLPPELRKFARGGRLDIVRGQVLDLPNGLLKQVAAHPDVFRVHYDRPIGAHNYRTSVTVGAKTVHSTLGYTGAGIGVAVIDSGIAAWHDDLTNNTAKLYPYGNQRVAKFVDFVNGRSLPYDDNGHGSHVAGTIAGNGYDSTSGDKSGIAPDASLVVLKVLDAQGKGTISNIIAALNWIAANANSYNVRVVNLSVGAGVYESYWTDPLTLAAKAITDKGIVVVAAAGNMGKNELGQLQWGGITAPGNAPWVLTVGASSTMGTLTRLDDQMASYSSSGPTYVDFLSKPDLVAPGTGTISLAVPGSTFYSTKSAYLVKGKVSLATMPYLSLSGTSMAAPVVSGTVALMLQANPKLTPNLVKGILQYTAQQYPGYSALRQGAGFLNSLGAVRLARYYATAPSGARMPVQQVWSRQIIWGNHRLAGGYINPNANAWRTDVIWGAAPTPDNKTTIAWGSMCGDAVCDNVVWGTETTTGDNVVWGTECADAVCDNVVWGTETTGDNVVWGTSCAGADCDAVVWGEVSTDGDNVVWGTCEAGDNVVWGTRSGLGIVWATSADSDVTWSSDSEDAVFYADDATEPLPDLELEFGDIVVTDPATTGSTTVSDGTTTVSTTTDSTTSASPPATDTTITTTGSVTGTETVSLTGSISMEGGL
jgi:serine protease AprX